MRDLGNVIFVARIWPSHPLAAKGIFDVSASIPNQNTAIHFVVEHSRSACRLSSNRRVVPRASSGTGNTFAVQVLGNCFRTFSICVFAKDAPHDVRFKRDDLTLAVLAA
jgi:hypothetical protein